MEEYAASVNAELNRLIERQNELLAQQLEAMAWANRMTYIKLMQDSGRTVYADNLLNDLISEN